MWQICCYVLLSIKRDIKESKVTIPFRTLQTYWSYNTQASVQFSSVAQSCPTLCNPMNCSTPGLPVHHQLPEFTQNHAH